MTFPGPVEEVSGSEDTENCMNAKPELDSGEQALDEEVSGPDEKTEDPRGEDNESFVLLESESDIVESGERALDEEVSDIDVETEDPRGEETESFVLLKSDSAIVRADNELRSVADELRAKLESNTVFDSHFHIDRLQWSLNYKFNWVDF